MHPFQINHTAKLIRSGAVVACPTEAVYGLSCHPLIPEAVSRILELKQRSIEKGLILVASNTEQLKPYVKDPAVLLQKNIQASWPGATSWLIPANNDAPAWLTGGHDTIVVRVTSHPVMYKLCDRCGHALVSTSANLSGMHPAISALQVRKAFGDSLDWILHADTGHNTHVSKIYTVNGQIIRA